MGLVCMAWALGLPVSRDNKKAVLLNAIHQTVTERVHAKCLADVAHLSGHGTGGTVAAGTPPVGTVAPPSAAAGAHGAPTDGDRGTPTQPRDATAGGAGVHGAARRAPDTGAAAVDMAVLNDILGISGDKQADSDTDGDWDKYEAGQVIEFFLRVDGEERIQAVAMDPSDQIRDVKDLLVNKLGFKVSVDSLRLTYGGKPLTEDGVTIEDYGIRPHSTVDVRLKEAFLLGAGKRARGASRGATPAPGAGGQIPYYIEEARAAMLTASGSAEELKDEFITKCVEQMRTLRGNLNQHHPTGIKLMFADLSQDDSVRVQELAVGRKWDRIPPIMMDHSYADMKVAQAQRSTAMSYTTAAGEKIIMAAMRRAYTKDGSFDGKTVLTDINSIIQNRGETVGRLKAEQAERLRQQQHQQQHGAAVATVAALDSMEI
jgi:hypothetical protein